MRTTLLALAMLLYPPATQAELVKRSAKVDELASPALEGEWRMFLPAGFEQPVKLVAAGSGSFRLEPGNLILSGRYEFRDGRLMSADAHDAPRGFFSWQIRSPHLLTLTQQRADVGSDYTGAILFRPAQK